MFKYFILFKNNSKFLFSDPVTLFYSPYTFLAYKLHRKSGWNLATKEKKKVEESRIRWLDLFVLESILFVLEIWILFIYLSGFAISIESDLKAVIFVGGGLPMYSFKDKVSDKLSHLLSSSSSSSTPLEPQVLIYSCLILDVLWFNVASFSCFF